MQLITLCHSKLLLNRLSTSRYLLLSSQILGGVQRRILLAGQHRHSRPLYGVFGECDTSNLESFQIGGLVFLNWRRMIISLILKHLLTLIINLLLITKMNSMLKTLVLATVSILIGVDARRHLDDTFDGRRHAIVLHDQT
jgi:hypothetical protein